jgi:hypothetical protein
LDIEPHVKEMKLKNHHKKKAREAMLTIIEKHRDVLNDPEKVQADKYKRGFIKEKVFSS